MTCPVCGATNEASAAFCFRCGTPLKSSTPAATGPTVNLNQANPPQATPMPAAFADETHARVYDAPATPSTSGQPFTIPPSSGPQYSPPGQYQTPTAAYGVTSNTALIALILGIASFVGLSILGAIPAIILGRNAQKEIRASGGRLTGEGMAQAGIVLGWINVALSVLAFCVFCALPFLAVLGSSTAP